MCIIYETYRILFTVSSVIGRHINSAGLKYSQFPTGQNEVSISRSFLREKPWELQTSIDWL